MNFLQRFRTKAKTDATKVKTDVGKHDEGILDGLEVTDVVTTVAQLVTGI